MASRSDFGQDWDEVVRDWCLGVHPPVKAEDGWYALGALERLWPQHLDSLLKQPGRGELIITPAIEIGLTLATCEKLKGFDQWLRRLVAAEDARPVLSEARLAAALVSQGYTPEFEPELAGKRPDIVVDVDGLPVYLETAAPDLSDAMKSAFRDMRSIADRAIDSKPGLSADVFLSADPTREVIESVIDSIRSAYPLEAEPEIRITLQDRALIRVALRHENPALVPDVHPDGPFLVVNHSRMESGVRTSSTIRLAMTDERAEMIMRGEAQHFSEDQHNVLVFDVSRIPGGLQGWVPLIKRRFQPTMNRRFGAVVLVRHGGRQWVVLPNPHALLHIPERLLSDIERLNGKP